MRLYEHPPLVSVLAFTVIAATASINADNCTSIDTEASCCDFTFQSVGVGLACPQWSCPHIIDYAGTFAMPVNGDDGFQEAAQTGTRGACRYFVATSCGTPQSPCVYSHSVTIVSCPDWTGFGDTCSR